MTDQAQHKTHGAVGIPYAQLVGAKEAAIEASLTELMERESGKPVDELVVVQRYFDPRQDKLIIEWKVKD